MSDDHPTQNKFRITDRRGQPKEEVVEPPRLAQETKQPAQTKKESPEQNRDHPTVDFSTFVVSMSTSALMHMGLIKDPHTGRVEKNLAMARQEVDILAMLQAKTRGNLTPDEKQLIDDALYELQLRFVESSK